MHNLLELTLAPQVPASVSKHPNKIQYHHAPLVSRIQQTSAGASNSSFHSPVALEHLQEYMIYAYIFYSSLLEEQTLEGFKTGWLEALGDLARYRMVMAGYDSSDNLLSGTDEAGKPVNQQDLAAQTQDDESFGRVDDSLGPSVGVAAARLLDSSRKQSGGDALRVNGTQQASRRRRGQGSCIIIWAFLVAKSKANVSERCIIRQKVPLFSSTSVQLIANLLLIPPSMTALHRTRPPESLFCPSGPRRRRRVDRCPMPELPNSSCSCTA